MFISFQFILFLSVLLILYYCIPKKFQWILLLAANFLFYVSAGHFYWVFLLFTSLTVYFAGIKMEQYDEKYEQCCEEWKAKESRQSFQEKKKKYKKKISNQRKRVMLFCLLVNLGILAVLKYTNFVIENINPIIKMTGNRPFSYADFILPMGISFYTFQAVGYLLDVYWNKCRAQKNPFKCILFLSFFPQLIQGPISRYQDLSKTLYQEHEFQWKQVRFGLERILYGYFKKLVIADKLSGVVAILMSDPEYYTGGYVFLGMLFYAAQLYADFTGGIDITIGIAESLGIHLQENFIRPFFSKNIAEYWRRWHISMGTWFRDYAFYPCSISRALKSVTSFAKKHFGVPAARRIAVYISTMLVWFLTGIWHGAAWHFVVWGLVNGVILLVSQELEPCYQKFREHFPSLAVSTGYRAFQVIRTFLLMCCIRMFDTYGSVKVSIVQFVHMFTKLGEVKITKSELLDLGLSVEEYLVVFLAVCVLFAVSMVGRNGSVREKISRLPYAVRFGMYLALFFATIVFGSYGIGFEAQQFIYNQF